VIPSVGRKEVLHETLLSLARQSLPPRRVIVSVPGFEHVEESSRALPFVECVLSPRGMTAQRNTGVRHLPAETELVAFFDDDVELAHDFLAAVSRAFQQNPGVVLLGANVVADGATRSGGLKRDEALRLFRDDDFAQQQQQKNAPAISPVAPMRAAYGCGMIVRRGVLDHVKFDEKLPLYSWLEDVDFSVRCAAFGQLARCDSARLVHLAVSRGRTSGQRFGFSQIMNPFYLWRKGTLDSFTRVVSSFWLKALAANFAGAFLPNKNRGAIDRRGRLLGNLLALGFIALGRNDPEHILRMK